MCRDMLAYIAGVSNVLPAFFVGLVRRGAPCVYPLFHVSLRGSSSMLCRIERIIFRLVRVRLGDVRRSKIGNSAAEISVADTSSYNS